MPHTSVCKVIQYGQQGNIAVDSMSPSNTGLAMTALGETHIQRCAAWTQTYV